MNNKYNNLLLQENGYPHRICDPDYSEEPVLTLNEAGVPVLETQSGCTMPADYSFACINNYVHCEAPMYEDLQNLALGMAAHIEAQARDADRYRYLRSTTKAIRDDNGENRIAITPSEFDSTIDTAIAASKEPK